MPEEASLFTLGVEEEYQIINPDTRALRPRAARVLPNAREDLGDDVTNEFYLSQIEIGTPICRTLAEVRAELVRLRRGVMAAGSRPPVLTPSRTGRLRPSRRKRVIARFKTTFSSLRANRSSSAVTCTWESPIAKTRCRS
jgi:gamma-glutamyl:cysteine ligase YbdK (ATP-grasp superfamily)